MNWRHLIVLFDTDVYVSHLSAFCVCFFLCLIIIISPFNVDENDYRWARSKDISTLYSLNILSLGTFISHFTNYPPLHTDYLTIYSI